MVVAAVVVVMVGVGKLTTKVVSTSVAGRRCQRQVGRWFFALIASQSYLFTPLERIGVPGKQSAVFGGDWVGLWLFVAYKEHR